MPSRKKTMLILFPILLIAVLGFAYFYWNYFLPIQDRISALTQSIKDEEKIISMLEQNEGTVSEELIAQTTSLQERLPVAPLLDQFILDLEQAEIASGSLITSFSFNEKESITQESVTGSNATEETEQQNESSVPNGTNNELTENNNLPAEVPLPEGIERLSVSMTVEAPTYFQLEAFIKVIEELPRITKIDSLTFTGNKEVRDVNATVNKLVYSVKVSTFYFPKLEELKNQLPTFETPAPAEKINPLYPTGRTKTNEDEGTQEHSGENNTLDEALPKTVQKNGKTYDIYTHKVVSGDTLYSLSMKYYGSRDGEQMIKEWNGITRLLAGDTLEIPILAEVK